MRIISYNSDYPPQFVGRNQEDGLRISGACCGMAKMFEPGEMGHANHLPQMQPREPERHKR